MQTKTPARQHTTDATTLDAYEKLMMYYENRFKPEHGQANYAYLSELTGMTRDMVKRYLVGTRKKIDLQHVASLMYYLTHYDYSYKTRTRLKPELKNPEYCDDEHEEECPCEACKKCVEEYNEEEKRIGCYNVIKFTIGCFLILILLGLSLVLLFLLRANHA